MSEEKTGGVAAMESTPANSSATVQDKETTAKDQRFSMIVVLKVGGLVFPKRVVWHMCCFLYNHSCMRRP